MRLKMGASGLMALFRRKIGDAIRGQIAREKNERVYADAQEKGDRAFYDAQEKEERKMPTET